MNKLLGLEDWKLDSNVPNDERLATVSIYLSYTDTTQIIDLEPKQRTKVIDRDMKSKFKQLLSLKLFNNYELIGTIRRPRGVKVKIHFDELEPLSCRDTVENVFIEEVTHAKKVRKPKPRASKFYCVRMTVVIEIEGLNTKMQSIEDRFVLIRAKSADDAYDKLDKRKDEYAAPYLNPSGRLVRWRIESFDDCYETDIYNIKDLEHPEGAEVYSKLKTRKSKDAVVWNGKS